MILQYIMFGLLTIFLTSYSLFMTFVSVKEHSSIKKEIWLYYLIFSLLETIKDSNTE